MVGTVKTFPVLTSTPLLSVALPRKLFPEPAVCLLSGVGFFRLDCLWLQTPFSRSGPLPRFLPFSFDALSCP